MVVNEHKAPAEIVCDEQTLFCQGWWVTTALDDIALHYQRLKLPSDSVLSIDTQHVDEFDTAGLWMLAKFIDYLKQLGKEVYVSGLSDKQTELLDKIANNTLQLPAPAPQPGFLEKLGSGTVAAKGLVLAFIAFIGEITHDLLSWFTHTRRIRWNSILSNIDTTGLQASPIIALLSFLIGLVLAYQVGVQLQSYGASIYVVDLLGLSLLREFSPLLTAIIVAGRSGSAFAAQIGTMKLNEEVDALKTFGISPVEVLVLPKVLGLLIALPLLTILAVCFSLLGGMVMSKLMLGISPVDFIARFGNTIHLKTLILGEIKTPVFAILIAAIGCFQGFLVTNSAASVGERTTISVVHSIFMIIVADAIFSIIYSALGV